MSTKLIFVALLLAVISALPYDDQMTLTNSLIVGREDDLTLWICKTCDDTNRPLHAHYIEEKEKDVKCILSVYPKFVVLAFRYTNTLLNVWQDILYPFQVADEHTCSNCKVQKAYNSMWNTIRDDVMADLAEIKRQTGIDFLYITGISLGGGLAGISFIDINANKLFGKVRVTTYGAPRVGNKHWAAHFDEITNGIARRYIVSGDPIVVLPRCLTLLCTYRHYGIKIVCYENQALCVQEEEIPDDFGTEEDQDESLESLVDHIDGYPKIYDFTLEIKATLALQ